MPTTATRVVRRIASVIAGVIASVVLVAVIGVLVLADTSWGHTEVTRLVLRAVRGPIHGIVRIGGLDGDLLDQVVVHDLSITDSAGAPFIRAKRAAVRYHVADIFRKRLAFFDVEIDHPAIALQQSQDNSWNYRRILRSSSQSTDTTSSGFGSYITLSGVQITGGDLVVRSPWRPDSALRGAARDSAIRVAVSQESRAPVSPAPGGYEKTIALHDLAIAAPVVRLADPAHPIKLVQIAGLSGQVAAFRPPTAVIRNLAGTFYLDRDSLWWPEAKIELPASRLAGRGAYELAAGDMRLRLRADSATLADLRFLDPRLPTEGQASADISVTWHGKTQDYAARKMRLATGRARASGQVGVTVGGSVVFHDTDVAFSSVDTRLITQLAPAAQVPGHGMVSGHATLSGPLAALTLTTDIAYDDDLAGSSHIAATGEVGMGDEFRARHLTVTLNPLQVALARMAHLSLPVGGTIAGEATIDGSTADGFAARADLVHHDGSALTHLVASGDVTLGRPAAAPSDSTRSIAVSHVSHPSPPPDAAGATGLPARFRPQHVDVEATLQPLDLTVVGKFVPTAKLHGQAAGTLRVHGDMGDLTVHSRLGLIGSPDSSGLTIDGHVHLDQTSPGYDLALAAHVFDAHAVSTAAPPTAITATMTARGQGTRPATLDASIAADVRASSIDSVGVDSVHLRATIHDGQLHVDTGHVRALATRADVAGTLGLVGDRSGTLTYRIVIDSLGRYQRFMPHDTTIVQPRPGPVAAAIAEGRADSARRADTTEIERAIRGLPPPQLVVDTPHAIRRDSLAGRALAMGTVQGEIHRFDVHGILDADSVVAMGDAVRRARVLYQWSGGPDLTAPIAAAVQLDTASIGGFAVDSVDARVTYHKPDGTLRLVVRQDPLRAYTVNTLFHYTPTDKQIRYDTLSFRFDTTLWRAPHPGSIDWNARGVALHQVELVDGSTGRILVDGLLATHADTSAHLHATVRRFEVANLVALSEEVVAMKGELSLDADLVGSTENPHLRGVASLSSATVRGFPLPNVYVTYEYDTTALRAHAELAPKGEPATPFATADATIPVNLAVGATGPRLLDRPLRGEIRLDSLPLDDVPQFASSVQNVGGHITGHVILGGTGRNPTGAGALALDSGTATVVATGMTLRSAAARIHLTRDSVVVDSLVARTPSTGGRLRFVGSLDRTDPAISVVNATLVSSNTRVLDSRERGRIDTDVNVTIAGPVATPYVYGTMTVRDGVYYLTPSNGKNLIDLRGPIVYSVVDTTNPSIRDLLPSSTSLLSRLLMDVDLTVNRNTWVRNNDGNVEAYSDGPLTLHIDHVHQALVVNGTINTEVGEYTFMGKHFAITKGGATFMGTPRINPSLQATGEYSVPGAGSGSEPLVINININGTLDSLRLSLSSDAQPPKSQTDLLRYLAFSGSTSGLAQASQTSSVAGGGTGGVVATASTFVENQLAAEAVGVIADQLKGNLARALNADVLDITTGNNYTDVAANKSNSAATFFQNTQLEFGKYFTPQTYVALQASAAPGGRVIHRVGQGLSLQLSGEPLYLLGQPTLATSPNTPLTGVLGLSLLKRWRF